MTQTENKKLISTIGKGFNAVLDQGMYELEWQEITIHTEEECIFPKFKIEQ